MIFIEGDALTQAEMRFTCFAGECVGGREAAAAACNAGTGRFELPIGSAKPRDPRRPDSAPRYALRGLGCFAGRQFYIAFAKLMS